MVEVTLALAVTSFCLITLLGLLPIGLRSDQASFEQTAANGILSAVSADLRATPSLSGTTPQFKLQIPSNPTTSSTATLYFSSYGQGPVSFTASPRYLVTVCFVPNGSPPTSGTSKAATVVNLQVSWPAAAPLANAAGSVQTLVALDRN
jgi:uncharacterized protein (TIGR02598 family)